MHSHPIVHLAFNQDAILIPYTVRYIGEYVLTSSIMIYNYAFLGIAV